MRLGIKGKQVLGVTSIVGVVVVVLSLLHLARLAQRQPRREPRARRAARQRDFPPGARGGRPTRRSVPGAARPIPGCARFSSRASTRRTSRSRRSSTRTASRSRTPIRRSKGRRCRRPAICAKLLEQPPSSQLSRSTRGQGRNLEFRQPLLLGDTEFGSIRIGVSTLLIRRGSRRVARVRRSLTALARARGVGVRRDAPAQLLLRPIHVIRSGLTRLGKGEFGVRLDLNQDDEFGELGTFFNTVSAQLVGGPIADGRPGREPRVGGRAPRGRRGASSSPRGELLFANPAMRTLLPAAAVGARLDDLVAADHPLRRLAEQTLMSAASRAARCRRPIRGTDGERLVMTHAVNDPTGELVGVMLIARNLEYLSQVQSTIRYSRKLAALGRLSAGVAHEVKNPLNAMMIHLELLRQQIGGGAKPRGGARLPPSAPNGRSPCVRSAGRRHVSRRWPSPEALQHVDVIASEIRRLDEVVQGFLKFTRPEDLKLQPVQLADALRRGRADRAARGRAASRGSSDRRTARARRTSTATRRCSVRRF